MSRPSRIVTRDGADKKPDEGQTGRARRACIPATDLGRILHVSTLVVTWAVVPSSTTCGCAGSTRTLAHGLSCIHARPGFDDGLVGRSGLGWVGAARSLADAGSVLRFRLLNLVACVILVIFNGLLGIWPMVAMNVALAGINVWFIRKLASERHSDVAFEVLEVGPFDEYLRHTLRVHA